MVLYFFDDYCFLTLSFERCFLNLPLGAKNFRWTSSKVLSWFAKSTLKVTTRLIFTWTVTRVGDPNLLLNHPDIIGFIYKQGNNLMKAFLCTKVVDWHSASTDDFKTIAAINGTTDNYTLFSVPENLLFSDQVHLMKIDERLVNNAHTPVRL